MSFSIHIENRHRPATVVAFSGIAPRNHVYEWTTSFADFPANLIGVRDELSIWYQHDTGDLVEQLRKALANLGTRWLACVGGSAGGFAALLFGRLLKADRILAFCPQSACGERKRALGDLRWRQYCERTPAADISGEYPNADVHYAANDDLDAQHASRIVSNRRYTWSGGGHDLPHTLKKTGKLRDILEDIVS